MWIDDQRVEKLLERPHSVGQNRANSQERPGLLLPRNTAATYRLIRVYAFQLRVLNCSVVSVISWTVDCQTPLSMGFSQEYWSRLSFPIPWDLATPGIEPAFPASPALAGRFFTSAPKRQKTRGTCLLDQLVLSRGEVVGTVVRLFSSHVHHSQLHVPLLPQLLNRNDPHGFENIMKLYT